ncbi:MAG: ribonuclease E/G [Clostridiales bacterium]|nr:ribonuclease E/G [Clostridiales bacterium]
MKKVIIECCENIIKTALLQDGSLIELIPSKKSTDFSVGDIFTGKIKRILKSGFAFIDIGSEKAAFLFFNDKKELPLKEIKIKEGSDLAVQIIREAEGEKGAAVTTALTLNGSLCVVSKGKGEIRISRKITDPQIRSDIREALSGDPFSRFDIIIRTKAESFPLSALKTEAESLIEELKQIENTGQFRKAPALLKKAESETLTAIKAFSAGEGIEVITNSSEDYLSFIDPEKTFTPTLYDEEIPLFRRYFIESKIDKLLKTKVWLKSGGWITIEPTEAMVVIDVNTGKNNSRSHRDTVLKTNKEAAAEILSQIRLRNLSGMIIIDFINMPSEEDNQTVLQILTEGAAHDRISTTVVGMTDLGLVLITRKKTGLPIAKILTAPCPCCGGTGHKIL